MSIYHRTGTFCYYIAIYENQTISDFKNCLNQETKKRSGRGGGLAKITKETERTISENNFELLGCRIPGSAFNMLSQQISVSLPHHFLSVHYSYDISPKEVISVSSTGALGTPRY